VIDMTEEAQFEALSSVITALADNPTSEALHYQSIRLSEEAGLSSDELEDARDTLTSLFPTTDGVCTRTSPSSFPSFTYIGSSDMASTPRHES
jgi:hypothetical protein